MFMIQAMPILGTTTELPRHYGQGKLRLDYQRQHLEHKKMSHADLMHHFDVARHRELDLVRTLERRRQIDESRDPRQALTVRARHAFGRMLIAAGERIRPETVAAERALNA